MAKEATALAPVAGLLATISKSRRTLAKSSDVLEVLKIRDEAEAMRQVIKTARAGLEAQNAAAELKLRAERRAGQLIRDMQESGYLDAGRGGDRKSRSQDATVKLSDIGIEKWESHLFQRVAALPDDEFQQYLIETADSKKELTSAEVRRKAKHYLRTKKQTESTANGHERAKGVIVTDFEQLFGQNFGTVYADPPWPYQNQATRASTKNHYVTMTIDDLCKLPVPEVVADDAHLHLWTTNAFLQESFELIDAWGFEYRSVFVWCKPQMGIGNYWRVSHEFLMLGVRGDAKYFGDRELMSWEIIDRTKHSRKPECVREKIERCSFGPYLEMFGRRAVDGWTVFGNEVEDEPALFGK